MRILQSTEYDMVDWNAVYETLPDEYFTDYDWFKQNYPSDDFYKEIYFRKNCLVNDIDNFDFNVFWQSPKTTKTIKNTDEPLDGRQMKSISGDYSKDERILWNIPNNVVSNVGLFDFLRGQGLPYELDFCRAQYCMSAFNLDISIEQDFYTPSKYNNRSGLINFSSNITPQGDCIVPCFEGNYNITIHNNDSKIFVIIPKANWESDSKQIPTAPHKFYSYYFINENSVYNSPVFTQYVKQEYTTEISNLGFLFVVSGQIVIEDSYTLNPYQIFTYDASNSLNIKSLSPETAVVGCVKLLNTPNTSGDLNRFFV